MNIDFFYPFSWLKYGFQKVGKKISLNCIIFCYEEAVLKNNIQDTHTDTLFFLYIWIWSFLIFKLNWESAQLIFCVSWKYAWIAGLWAIERKPKLAAAVFEWNAVHWKLCKSIFYTKLLKLSSSWHDFQLFDHILKVTLELRYQQRCFANFIFCRLLCYISERLKQISPSPFKQIMMHTLDRESIVL